MALTSRVGDDPSRIVYLPDAPRLREVFAHELAHAFGLTHTTTGLMAPMLGETPAYVTDAECTALARR